MQLYSYVSKEYHAYDKRRDDIIRASRDVLRNAKKIIFLCHEGKLIEAEKMLNSSTVNIVKLEAKFSKPLSSHSKNFNAYSEGSWSAGVEEYLEALFFFAILKNKKLTLPKSIMPSAPVVVGALSDMTGELVRVSVNRGAKKAYDDLEYFRKVTAEVVKQLLPLHLTGQSRQKFDSAKRNLKRIEEIIYEVNIRS